MNVVEFYFDYRSPYSYVAHSQLGDLDVAVKMQPTAVAALLRARWGEPKPLATAADVAAVLARAGLDAAAIEPLVDTPEMDAALDEATAEAASRGVFGAPTFVVGDQMFFGNDRLDFLREALAKAA